MTGISVEQPDDTAAPSNVLLSGERWAAVVRAHDRKFWAGLAVAMLLHSLLLIGINLSKPKQIGDPSGADNAISVDLVTEADLESRSTVTEKGGAPEPPAPQTPPAETPRPPEPQSQPPPETKAEAEPEKKPDEKLDVKPEPVAEPVSEPKTEPKPESQDPIRPTIAEDIPDVLALPEEGPEPDKKVAAAKPEDKPQEKPPEKKQEKKPEKPPQKKTAALDLTPPAPSFTPPVTGGGGGAGLERPPGITRSGANDAFARGVIRALQKTMPQLSNTLGRVTVRIILGENGNLASVKVVRASDIAGLDQSVMFATQQTSYPFPPPNSKDVDRIFTITYIYR